MQEIINKKSQHWAITAMLKIGVDSTGFLEQACKRSSFSFDLYVFRPSAKAINSVSLPKQHISDVSNEMRVIIQGKSHPQHLFEDLQAVQIFRLCFSGKIAYHKNNQHVQQFTRAAQSERPERQERRRLIKQCQMKDHHRLPRLPSSFSVGVAYKAHPMKQLDYNQALVGGLGVQMSEIEESEDYAPERDRSSSEPEGEVVYKRRVEKFNEKSIEGKWTEQENLRYILYMDAHYKIFVSKEKRKSERIFKSLSEFLVTRTPRQCRSHFQKIMNKFANLRKVRQFYQEELGLSNYQARLDELTDELKRKDIKTEETEPSRCLAIAHISVQTEPLSLSLSDLSNQEILKLMNLLYEYQKVQLPMPPWHAGFEETAHNKEKETN